MNPKKELENKVAVVTGATSGIGLHTATAFARSGAFVIGVGRARDRCDQAIKTIQAAYPQARIRYLIADLSLQNQVRQLAIDIQREISEASFDALDILVNNAGVYSDAYVKTTEGIELTFAVNHLAPFLLTHELLPILSRSTSARIITISSDSHRRTFLNLNHLNTAFLYNGLWAYKVSKLSNILFTLELNRRMANTSVHAFAVDPGLVNTEIGAKGAKGIARLIWQIRRKSGVHPDVPVQTIVYLTGDNIPQKSHDIYWYDCKPATPSRQAQREDLAKKLWNLSCQMCRIIDPERETKDE